MKFIDVARIHVKAGDGGAGSVSFRREKYIPRGGPDGGDGGRGGSIVLRASYHLNTLLDFQFKRHYAARRGEHGLGSLKTGKSSDDIILDVPIGTLVRDTGTGELLGDLSKEGERLVVARGGLGGRGNAAFASPTHQVPRDYEVGEQGEEREIELELKLIADVGLVGLPNAGKSTLISVISAAKPKIADYPFTTLVPNLGIVGRAEGASFVVADIPGLIEGAHEGRGLGIQFLRHVERTHVLVFLLDGTSDDIKKDFRVLRNELKLFDPGLLKKPRIIAITKMDIVMGPRLRSIKATRFGLVPVFWISAAAREGLSPLVEEMWRCVSRHRGKVVLERDKPVQTKERRKARKKTLRERKPTRGRRRPWEKS